MAQQFHSWVYMEKIRDKGTNGDESFEVLNCIWSVGGG